LTPEKTIQTGIEKFLVANGYLVIRINSGIVMDTGRYTAFYRIINNGSSSGVADLIAIKATTIVFVEVKTAKGRLSESQRKFAALCTKYGTPYIVARSVEDVKDYIIGGIIKDLPKAAKKRNNLTTTDLRKQLEADT
jgi:hypothetical protein